MSEAELLPVIQDDREAAWPVAPVCYRNDPNPGAQERWMSGRYDGTPFLQAFAAHRLRHSTDFERGLEAGAKACEQQARDFLDPQYATGQPLSTFNERFACDECAKAIRAMKGQP